MLQLQEMNTELYMINNNSLGQYYCTPCGRHFIDEKTRDVHLKTKVHKRRLELLSFLYIHLFGHYNTSYTNK
jgi:hypothetical protein